MGFCLFFPRVFFKSNNLAYVNGMIAKPRVVVFLFFSFLISGARPVLQASSDTLCGCEMCPCQILQFHWYLVSFQQDAVHQSDSIWGAQSLWCLFLMCFFFFCCCSCCCCLINSWSVIWKMKIKHVSYAHIFFHCHCKMPDIQHIYSLASWNCGFHWMHINGI